MNPDRVTWWLHQRPASNERRTRTKKMRQQIFYDPIRVWLTNNGFRCLITGQKRTFVIPVSHLAPGPYKIPDLVGISEDNRVVIVEVEKNKLRFFDALGRCMLWRTTATFVYLAFPKDEIQQARMLERLGVGLLEVDSASKAVTEKISLPKDDLFRVLELHPTDFSKEQQLAGLLRETLPTV